MTMLTFSNEENQKWKHTSRLRIVVLPLEKISVWLIDILIDSFNNLSKFAQFSSVAQSCPTLCNPMDHSMPGLPVHHQLPEFTQTHVLVMPSNHLILCHPLLLPPSIFPSISVFSNESVLYIRWPKDWSFSFNIPPSNEYSGLISFRMAWLDLLAVQVTLKSLLQHHSSKASILWHSAFFIVQLSHPYMTTGKTITLTRWTFAGKVMSLLFNMLSRLVITFLPRSKHLLICSVMAISISRASSRLRDPTWVSCTASRFFTVWATRKAHVECLFQCASAYHLAGTQSMLQGDS